MFLSHILVSHEHPTDYGKVQLHGCRGRQQEEGQAHRRMRQKPELLLRDESTCARGLHQPGELHPVNESKQLQAHGSEPSA